MLQENKLRASLGEGQRHTAGPNSTMCHFLGLEVPPKLTLAPRTLPEAFVCLSAPACRLLAYHALLLVVPLSAGTTGTADHWAHHVNL